jgi:hypothetical protein
LLDKCLPLESPPPQTFCFLFVFQTVSCAFVQAGLGLQSSYICLLISCDYRHVPPLPAT